MCKLYNDFQGISLENYQAQSVGILGYILRNFFILGPIVVLNKMNAFCGSQLSKMINNKSSLLLFYW